MRSHLVLSDSRTVAPEQDEKNTQTNRDFLAATEFSFRRTSFRRFYVSSLKPVHDENMNDKKRMNAEHGVVKITRDQNAARNAVKRRITCKGRFGSSGRSMFSTLRLETSLPGTRGDDFASRGLRVDRCSPSSPTLGTTLPRAVPNDLPHRCQ